MIKAPVKNKAEVPRTVPGVAIGIAIGAARRVEKIHGNMR
jgi:hypothetical protein